MGLSHIFFAEEKIQQFEDQLSENFSLSLGGLYSKALLAGAILSLAFLCFALFFELQLEAIIVFFALFLFVPLVFSMLYYSYLIERRKKSLEQEAPMLLLQASVFPRGTPVSSIIAYLSRKENGLLGREFLKSKKEIEKGASVETALRKLKHRNNSPIIERLVDMLLIAYGSGECLGESFRELAEELLEMQSILAEKKASLAIEKATLLIGSAFVVPFILGILTGLVFEFDFEGIELAGFSSSEQRTELLSIAFIANQFYIIEYALIASVFLGWLEGRPRKAFVYALALLPLSTLVFVLSQGLSVI